ncbi:CLAVATA3/ESR (CLE)-related protein 46-like [Pistacia vera]|uniref:CLAVATA3/ESR (CLE)-related protein 46-like n=1 Tax=Pistacia vera TaxID=55513 RepID=UPI001263555B|nr:CLAVATA3/ESR (CLE)-related protein 46-like [Pistacia vera]
MKNEAYILFIVLSLIASHCSSSTDIGIQAAKSVDLMVEPAKPRMSTASRDLLGTWIKLRKQVTDSIHKVPSGPNPIGNVHPPSKP